MVLKAPGPTTKYAFSATVLFIQSPQCSTEKKNLKSFFVLTCGVGSEQDSVLLCIIISLQGYF